MKTLRLEKRDHSGPARSIRPGAVNQDNISGPLRGVHLSVSSHVESGRQDQHHGCDQSGSVHLRELHFYLLIKLTVGSGQNNLSRTTGERFDQDHSAGSTLQPGRPQANIRNRLNPHPIRAER